MLGGATFNILWRDGYEALTALDRDGDGWVRGDELAHLAVWCDANGDGICQSEELHSLSELGITGLSTRAVKHPDGFPYSPDGVEYLNGKRGPSFDWISTSSP